jgi:hypothetical protein
MFTRQKSFILRAVNSANRVPYTRKIRLTSVLIAALLAILAGHFYLYGQDKSEFPEGFDAVQAAPSSHKLILENALVRVLEVTVPSPGTTVPMHHHRWPSFFLDWDTGGGTPHIRYHRADGSVRDQPSITEPGHAGVWSVQWMKPEPMHAIEVVRKTQERGDGF